MQEAGAGQMITYYLTFGSHSRQTRRPQLTLTNAAGLSLGTN